MSALPRTSPESVGIPSTAIHAFLDGIDAAGIELHSFMILRHGKVAAAAWFKPFQEHSRHLLYSLSKSFTSTAIGFAVSEGLLSLDDSVISFFPDEVPGEPSERLKRLTVRHMLSMSAGHSSDSFMDFAAGHPTWIGGILHREIVDEPGTKFLYNNAATYSLSAILHKLTGQSLTEYLRPRLFDPIGIQSTYWERNEEGIELGATGLYVVTEAIARFGLLYLQDGIWVGKRVLPEGWAAEATKVHIANSGDGDWGLGYGFQFWRSQHNAYRGDGAFGQNCIVVPHEEMVVVTTAAAHDLQALLNQVWTHLLPNVSSESLPETQSGLGDRLANLVLKSPTGRSTSPLTESISGKTYTGENGHYRFDFETNSCTLNFSDDKGEHIISAGMNHWVTGITDFDSSSNKMVGAFAVWLDNDQLVIKVNQLDAPTSYLFSCQFVEDRLFLEVTRNHTFAPAEALKTQATILP